MNPELMNHRAMRQRAMSQKVFKCFFFLLSPLNHAFKVEKALLLLRLFCISCRLHAALSAVFLWLFLPWELVKCWCSLLKFSFVKIGQDLGFRILLLYAQVLVEIRGQPCEVVSLFQI